MKIIISTFICIFIHITTADANDFYKKLYGQCKDAVNLSKSDNSFSGSQQAANNNAIYCYGYITGFKDMFTTSRSDTQKPCSDSFYKTNALQIATTFTKVVETQKNKGQKIPYRLDFLIVINSICE